jgi:hypothetical protein
LTIRVALVNLSHQVWSISKKKGGQIVVVAQINRLGFDRLSPNGFFWMSRGTFELLPFGRLRTNGEPKSSE